MQSFTLPNVQPILDRIAKDVDLNTPKLGIVLGSGLGNFVDQWDNLVRIPYAELPDWPTCSVKGHAGNLCIGQVHGTTLVGLQGRPHWYEGNWQEAFLMLMKTLQAIHCEQVIITNAAGAINPAFSVGSLVMISDHINLQGINPLVGLLDTETSTFVGLENAYDLSMNQTLARLAQDEGINLHEGTYCGTLGPCFETPAEIRAFKHLGADVVGMSTVPEVIAARFFRLPVAAISVVSNAAAGQSDEPLSHELTLQGVQHAGEHLTRLLVRYAQSFDPQRSQQGAAPTS